MAAKGRCDPVRAGEREAMFAWRPAERRDVRQLIEITQFRDGFETEQFEVVATAPGGEDRVQWRGGEPGISYFWRVVTVTPDGRRTPGPTARFDPPICPLDFQPGVEGDPPGDVPPVE